MDDQTQCADQRTPSRKRHDLRLRSLEVIQTAHLSPSMIRLTLGGAEMEGFVTQGFDDHVKLLVPDPLEDRPRLPVIGPNGISMPDGMARPIARDYTIRRHDAASGRLDIDFVLHEHGPAAAWAAKARPGDPAWIVGPRGSFIVPLAFDWHLLIGDETALPAITRRLEELPPSERAVAIIEVADKGHEVPVMASAESRLIWVHRSTEAKGSTKGFLHALETVDWPDGDFHAWLGCESQVVKVLREWLINERNANPKWMRASGYWRLGEAGYHDHHD